MSLVTEAMRPCVRYTQSQIPDGEGGDVTRWVPHGDQFMAAIVIEEQVEAEVASQQKVKSLYTVTVPTNVNLPYHEIFKRLTDGKMFRMISDNDDKITPARATFQFRQGRAEEWYLTDDWRERIN